MPEHGQVHALSLRGTRRGRIAGIRTDQRGPAQSGPPFRTHEPGIVHRDHRSFRHQTDSMIHTRSVISVFKEEENETNLSKEL